MSTRNALFKQFRNSKTPYSSTSNSLKRLIRTPERLRSEQIDTHPRTVAVSATGAGQRYGRQSRPTPPTRQQRPTAADSAPHMSANRHGIHFHLRPSSNPFLNSAFTSAHVFLTWSFDFSYSAYSGDLRTSSQAVFSSFFKSLQD